LKDGIDLWCRRRKKKILSLAFSDKLFFAKEEKIVEMITTLALKQAAFYALNFFVSLLWYSK